MLGGKEKFVLIDVRRPDEFDQGNIPNSINVPRKDPSPIQPQKKICSLFFGLTVQVIECALSNPEEWKKFASLPFPGKEEEIVFYCKGGLRAEQGAQIASKFGFKNIKNYRGSYDDWIKEEK